MPDYPAGEGPIDDPEEAKKRAKAEREKPEHKVKPGDADDMAAADADLDDPGKQKEEPE